MSTASSANEQSEQPREVVVFIGEQPIVNVFYLNTNVVRTQELRSARRA